MEIGVESGVDVPEEQAWQLFWSLVGAYRLASLKGKTEAYIKSIQARVIGHFRLSPFEASVGDTIPLTMAPMLDKLEHAGLIACLDMFFNRFSDHEFAGCRLGTLSSRYRNCATLTSLIFFAYQVNRKFTEVFEHFPFMELVPELRRLTDPNEQGEPDPYSPYIKDLGICKVSPYSSTANPLVYTLLHITGTALGHERSMKAVKVGDMSKDTLLRMGCIAAMCLRNYSGYEMIAASNRELMEERKAGRLNASEFASAPDLVKYDNVIAAGGKISQKWFRSGTGWDVLEMLRHSDGLFDSFRKTIKARISYCKMRNGSFGNMVQEYVTAPDLN